MLLLQFALYFYLFWKNLSKFDKKSFFLAGSFFKKTCKTQKNISKFTFQDIYRSRTARSQSCFLILFKLKNSSLKTIKDKKIKEQHFFDRLVEFYFILYIAKNS